MSIPPPSRTQADRSDLSRQRILDAALLEFSSEGLAGARTDRIAAAAGVNKALLYYYFESKENLYLALPGNDCGAGAGQLDGCVSASSQSPGERVVRFALNHFDRILCQREFQSLMQQEMIRVHKGEASAIPILVKRVFSPVHAMFQSLVREGIASGELIVADRLQISALRSEPMFFIFSVRRSGVCVALDPFAPEVLAERRGPGSLSWAGSFYGPRARGSGRGVLADTPMPEINPQDQFPAGGTNERTQ